MKPSDRKDFKKKTIFVSAILIGFMVILIGLFLYISKPIEDEDEENPRPVFGKVNDAVDFGNSPYPQNELQTVEITAITVPYGANKGMLSLKVEAYDEMPPTYAYTLVDGSRVVLADTLGINLQSAQRMPFLQYRWQLKRYNPASGDRSYMIVSYPFPGTCLPISDPNVVVNDPFLRHRNTITSNNTFEFVLRGEQLYNIRVAHTNKYLRISQTDGRSMIEYGPVEKAVLWFVGPERMSFAANYFLPRIYVDTLWPLQAVKLGDINVETDTYEYSTIDTGVVEAKVWVGIGVSKETRGSFVELQVSKNKTYTKDVREWDDADDADDQITYDPLSQNNMMILAEDGIVRGGTHSQFMAYRYRMFYKLSLTNPKEVGLRQVAVYGWFYGGETNLRWTRPHRGFSVWTLRLGEDSKYSNRDPEETTYNNNKAMYYSTNTFYISRAFNIYQGQNNVDATCLFPAGHIERCRFQYPRQKSSSVFPSDFVFGRCKDTFCIKNMLGYCANYELEASGLGTRHDSAVKKLFRITTIELKPTGNTITTPSMNVPFGTHSTLQPPDSASYSSYFTDITDREKKGFFVTDPFVVGANQGIVSNAIYGLHKDGLTNIGSELGYDCENNNSLLFGM